MENKFEFGDEVMLTSQEKYRVVQIIKDSKGISYKLQNESGVCRYVNEDSLELYSEMPKFEVGKWYKAVLSHSDYYLKYMRTENVGGEYNRIWGEVIHPFNVPIYRENDYLANINIKAKLTLLTDLSEIQQYLPDGHCDKVKPKLTVKSEMERLGLAVGDKVRVTEEAVKSAFYDEPTKRFETLDGVRGEEYTINRGVILEDKLFLIMEEFYSPSAILAPTVTKISGFTLGSYKVTVLSSDKVKIGCTTFDIDTVLGLLEDFMTITTKAGTPDDYIKINSIKVDYKKAKELYDFIAN